MKRLGRNEIRVGRKYEFRVGRKYEIRVGGACAL
jgi:hypothetical protein